MILEERRLLSDANTTTIMDAPASKDLLPLKKCELLETESKKGIKP